MAFAVRVTGLAETSRALGQSAEQLRDDAVTSVNTVVDRVAVSAARRFSQRVNLSAETLSQFIFTRRASVRADGVSGSVTLQVKAVPLSLFAPRVSVEQVTYNQVFGRSSRSYTRPMASVSVQIYRDQPARKLVGAFPLRQRNAGPLAAGELVRKRAGSGFGERSDGSVGSKLTGFRYFTFPRKITDAVLPELQAEAGQALSLEFRTAYRSRFGQLRKND